MRLLYTVPLSRLSSCGSSWQCSVPCTGLLSVCQVCCTLLARLEGLEPGLAAERAEAVFAQIDTDQVSTVQQCGGG